MPFNDAIKELLQMEEVYLLDEAAHAIGAKGVTGINTPAILPFFMLALKIIQTLYSELQLNNDTVVEIAEKPVVRQKSGWGRNSSSCYGYRSDPECRGLCSPLFTCW